MECTQEYISANVQIIPVSGILELISQVFINDPRQRAVELLRTGSNYYLGWSLANNKAYYFNSICRCLFTHVVFINPPPAGHPCPLSALEHAMSSLSAPRLKRDLKDSYTHFRTVG